MKNAHMVQLAISTGSVYCLGLSRISWKHNGMSEGWMCLCVFLACMPFGIHIVVFNTCLVCGLEDMYERGCYRLNLPPSWIVDGEGAYKLCPGSSLMGFFYYLSPCGAGGEGSSDSLQSRERTTDMSILSKSV